MKPFSVPYGTEVEAVEGQVVFYGEGTSPFFALNEMPEGVAGFVPSGGRAEAFGRLALRAMERCWKVTVYYTHQTGSNTGFVLELHAELP